MAVSLKAKYSTTKMLTTTTSALILFLVVLIACTSLSSKGGTNTFMNITVKPLKAHIHATTVSPALNNASPQKLLSIALKAALAVVHESNTFAKNCSKFSGAGQQGLHLLELQAIEDCIEMMGKATDQLNLAIANLSSITGSSTNGAEARSDALLNLNVWLSASLSFQATCSDGFQFVRYGKCEKAMLKRQEQVAEVLANSLDMVKKLFERGKSSKGAPHRRHLLAAADANAHNENVNQLKDGFPGWLSSPERNLLLQAPVPEPWPRVQTPVPSPAPTEHPQVYADMVVAQDGSGDYLNISAALNDIPAVRATRQVRFVVYIREGVYEEIVTVPKNLVNLTFVGDGIGQTVITGSNNVGSGLFNTLRTATFGNELSLSSQ